MVNTVVIKVNINMRMANVFIQMVQDTLSMKNIKKIKINDHLEIDKTGKKLGVIHLNRISENLSADDIKSFFIKFDKGSKSKIHIHDSEQIIVEMKGIGQLVIFSKIGDNSFEIKEILELKEYEAVLIPSGTPHWHGAIENKDSSQLSFMKNGNTAWFDF